ncbi:death-associated protein 1 isoform X1 [Odocoileus virginianus]|uniref:Death-associated protein 1 isoform X1 n=1 Tax=Odocoileus virginianus TaxID=9874 RepID=A0ABM4IXQ4_ODOVR
MSSPPEGKLETKAGHPPAVKAGGMRIVQKHPHSGDTKEEKDKDDQEWESPRQKTKDNRRQRQLTLPWSWAAWMNPHLTVTACVYSYNTTHPEVLNVMVCAVLSHSVVSNSL